MKQQSCLIYLSLAGPLVGFILVGKGFRRAFRKGRWVVEQDFHGNSQVNVTWFFAFSPVSLTDLCSFWYGLKDPFHSAQVSGQRFL